MNNIIPEGTTVKILDIEGIKSRYRGKSAVIICSTHENEYDVKVSNGDTLSLFRNHFAVDEADEKERMERQKVIQLLLIVEEARDTILPLLSENTEDIFSQTANELNNIISKINKKIIAL